MPKGIYTRKPWSEERKKRHSLALKGRVITEETRIKISEKQKGVPKPPRTHKYTWNEESRRRCSERQKGMIRKKHTLESRQLMSRIARERRPVLVTDESSIARKRFEYSMWRQAVYARDDYTCLRCKRRGGRLNPHHIENFAENRESRYDVRNGGTLCISCHKDFHKRYGKKRNNRIQFVEFLQVFLPYVWTGKTTFYEMLKSQNFKMLTDGK